MKDLTQRMNLMLKVILVCAVLTTAPEAWADVQCLVEVDQGVLLAGQTQRAVVKVTLNAMPSSVEAEKAERPPVNLSVVLDRSGSMTGEKLQKAKEAAIEALRRLEPRDIFSLVIYDHEVETLIPAQSARNLESIEPRIQNISARGNTALFGGVSQGAAEIRKNPESGYVHRIILLSDGLANVGPSTPEDLGRLGVAFLKEGISVSTVGVGVDYNEDLMTRLSQRSDGNTYFVESSRDLPHIFSAELGDVLNVAAKEVLVVIECPEGVRPVGIIGREGQIKGQRAELSLNQLYGGQQKYALLEVEVAPAKANENREIAVAKLSYADALTQKQMSALGRANVRFSKDQREVQQSANVSVQRDYHLNLNAIAQDKAISFADEGQKQQAATELKKSGKKLKEAGTQNKDEELIRKGKEMEEKAAQIESEGMSKRERKTLRTESYQERNQQLKR